MFLEKGDIIECRVDDVGMYGEGIAHIQGLTVFIPGAIAGEVVKAKAVLVKPTMAHAVLVELRQPSRDRTVPPCPYFKQCGGCSMQHISYERQLQIKRGIVQNALKKIAAADTAVDEVQASDKQYRYRNKLSLPVRVGGKGQTECGFFAKRSHRVVPIEDCLLQKEDTVKCALSAVDFALAQGLRGYDEQTGGGELRHVTVRLLGEKITLTYVLNRIDDRLVRALRDSKHYMPQADAIFLNINDSRSNVILGKQTLQIRQGTRSQAGSLAVEVHPASFFQVNDGIREKLYSAVCDEIQSKDSVVDAYSGAGYLSALISKKAKAVTAVEIVKEAVDSARKLIEYNGIENVRLICGDCAQCMSGALDSAKRSSDSGDVCVVLDPPKAGCDERVIHALCGEGSVKKIIYVSCNPATLARDIAMLMQGGYTLTRVKPYDMFPNTMSVETLAVLVRNR